MRKFLSNPWIVGALALAAVAFVGGSIYKQMKPAYPVVVDEASAGASGEDTVDSSFIEAAGSDGIEADELPATLREALLAIVPAPEIPDPFEARSWQIIRLEVVPVERPPDIVETIRLGAIWSQGDVLLVLVNGRIQQTGDSLGRMTIDAASLDGIWISHRQGRDFLPLGATYTLTTPADVPAASAPNVALHEG
jgi:hypothetical protein